jgi:hypothetical protein
MGFRRSVPWASQPQGAVGVVEPYRAACVHAVIGPGTVSAGGTPSAVWDIASQTYLTVGPGSNSGGTGGPAAVGAGSPGLWVKTDNGFPGAFQSGYINLGSLLSARHSTGKFTILAVINRVSGAQNALISVTPGASLPAGTLSIQWWDDNNWYFDVNNETQRVSFNDTFSGDCTVLLSWDNTSKAKKLWRNGTLIFSDTSDTDSISAGSAVYKAMAGLKCYAMFVFDNTFSNEQSLSLNPYQVIAPTRRSLGGIAGTISRPGTDVASSGWSFTAASLAGSINEVTRDDASYAQAPYGVTGAITTLDLPLAAGSYTLSFAGQYLAANASSGQFRFTALDSSNTSLGVSAWTAVTSTASVYTVALTVSGGTATRLKIEIQA